MLGKLLKKELMLCLHPTVFLMLLLTGLLLTPNYPYTIMYFYLTLGIFFICLGGRENADITFTMTLPVAKRDIVAGRMLLAVLLELTQLLLAALLIPLRQRILSGANAAGMDANLALLGEGFLFYGVFQLVFFPAWYRNTNRVGLSFIKSSVALFLLTGADIVLSYALPFWRDVLDTPDPQNLGTKVVFLLVCLLFYLAATWAALRISRRRFERQDIR